MRTRDREYSLEIKQEINIKGKCIHTHHIIGSDPKPEGKLSTCIQKPTNTLGY